MVVPIFPGLIGITFLGLVLVVPSARRPRLRIVGIALSVAPAVLVVVVSWLQFGSR